MAATPSTSGAAEITLLGPASFRVLFPELLPQFEKASGDTVKAAYAPLGVITDRVIKGEAIDVAIVSSKQNEELQKQGKLLAGSRVEIAQVGFTVFVKKGAAILSAHLRVPIYPVALEGFFEVWPRGKGPQRFAPLKISFLDPVFPPADVKDPEAAYEQIMSEVRRRIVAEWERLSASPTAAPVNSHAAAAD